MDVSKLEPAERNFKREVITLITILVIAFGAGGLILFNYIRMRTTQNEEMREGRAPEIGELVKNYSYIDKLGKEASFFDCTGQVTLLACISVKQLEDSGTVIDVLKHFEEVYKEDDRVNILLLSMDNEEDLSAEQVVPVLEKAGLNGEKWEVAMSNGDLFLAYIKKQLKFIHLAKVKTESGDWFIPQRIRILGPDLKLRGKEGEYDFAKILTDQRQAKEELKQNDKFKNDPKYQGDFLVDYAKGVMEKNITWILENEEFDKEKIDEAKKKNIYKPYLYLFAGFIIFIVVLGLKVSRKQAKA